MNGGGGFFLRKGLDFVEKGGGQEHFQPRGAYSTNISIITFQASYSMRSTK